MRKTLLLVVLIAMVALSYAWWKIGCIRGAGQALTDFSLGRPALYELGCVSGPPAEPVAFRVWELLGRDYGVRIETIGGIGPSRFQADFAETYDSVMLWLMERRHGRDFLDRLEERARADIFTQRTELVGELHVTSRQLIVAPRIIYRLSESEEVVSHAQPLDGQIVRVTGTMLEIRDSKWTEWGVPSIHAEEIQAEPNGPKPLPN